MLDTSHQLDALFGVVNIPNVVWIDEDGIIVRPAEPGFAPPTPMPESFLARLAERAAEEQQHESSGPGLMDIILTGQDRAAYPDAIRDWVRNGSDSSYVLPPDEVVGRSQPRGVAQSEAAAHFDLAVHLWHDGDREGAIEHFNACHRLQPENWTYKRQAWSLIGNERSDSEEYGRFDQGPRPGQEAEWPFESSFDVDVLRLNPGEYYPATM